MEKKNQGKEATGTLMDIEISMKRNDLTMIIRYNSRSYKVVLSSQDARTLSDQLAKAADFLEKPDVIS